MLDGSPAQANAMLNKTYPYYLANQPRTSKTMLDVRD
jgi:hypothetical protein